MTSDDKEKVTRLLRKEPVDVEGRENIPKLYRNILQSVKYERK